MVEKADKDGDGLINFKEFEYIMNQMWLIKKQFRENKIFMTSKAELRQGSLPPASPKHPRRLERSPSMSTVSASPSRLKMYSSIKFKANLENFNGAIRNHILSSPRSIEACKRVGVEIKTLYAKTLADIRGKIEWNYKRVCLTDWKAKRNCSKRS